MLSQVEIRTAMDRRVKATVPWTVGVFVAMCGYMGLIAAIGKPVIQWMVAQWGKPMEEWGGLILMLPVLPILIGGFAYVDWLARPYRTVCPSCQKDVSPYWGRLVALRRCPQCQEHIVEGRPRSQKAYFRYSHRRFLLFLRGWLWAWPAMGLGMLIWGIASPKALALTIPLAAAGVFVAGYCWLRTWDIHYVWPCVVALLIGGLAYFAR